MSQSKRGDKVKSKRSKRWNARMHKALVQHLINADPEYAFEAAVLGEQGMRDKYTHRQLHNMISMAQHAKQVAKSSSKYGMGGGGQASVSPGGVGGAGLFTIPGGVSSLRVTIAGGGGGGSHAADAMDYAPGRHPYLIPPKK